MICSARAVYEQWPTISATGVLTRQPDLFRAEPTPAQNGYVIDIGTEADIRFLGGLGNEFVRFGNPARHRSYEIAGTLSYAASDRNP